MTMKSFISVTSSLIFLVQILPYTTAFPSPQLSLLKTRHVEALSTSSSVGATKEMNDDSNRRLFLNKSLIASSTAIVAFLPAQNAMAAKAEFFPTYDDIKVIYALGVTLDNLATSCGSPDTFSKALEGLIVFNRAPNFYTTFAQSFVGKTVKNNADGDPRVGKIRQASSLISSLQELLEGRQGLLGQDASKEAVKRVRSAQSLIASFLNESGVEDDKVKAFVKAHPL